MVVYSFIKQICGHLLRSFISKEFFRIYEHHQLRQRHILLIEWNHFFFRLLVFVFERYSDTYSQAARCNLTFHMKMLHYFIGATFKDANVCDDRSAHTCHHPPPPSNDIFERENWKSEHSDFFSDSRIFARASSHSFRVAFILCVIHHLIARKIVNCRNVNVASVSQSVDRLHLQWRRSERKKETMIVMMTVRFSLNFDWIRIETETNTFYETGETERTIRIIQFRTRIIRVMICCPFPPRNFDCILFRRQVKEFWSQD